MSKTFLPSFGLQTLTSSSLKCKEAIYLSATIDIHSPNLLDNGRAPVSTKKKRLKKVF